MIRITIIRKSTPRPDRLCECSKTDTQYLLSRVTTSDRVFSGMISDDPGIKHVGHLTHFYGENDPLQRLGETLWSGRWQVMGQPDWNRAKDRGRISMVNLGPMAHNAYGGYYDVRVKLPDGENHYVVTAKAVQDAVNRLNTIQ